jgi:hypothetical protein
MAPTRLTSGRAENHSAAYTTDAISPAPNRLILAWALNVQTAAGNPDMPAAAAAGLTLEQVATVLVAGTPDRRLTCFRAMSLAPGTGAITFTFATLQAHCAWSIFAYDDFDPSGTNGAAAIAQHKSASGKGATLSLALDPLGDTARSIVAAGLILRGSKPVNPGAGLVEIDEQVFPAASAATLEMAARVGGGETVSWSWTGAEDAAAIAIEIKPPPIVVQLQARDDPEALARKFEPIVIFHPDERFFPCDAKRYVEHCAMWKAEAPFDNKAAWGGIGQPFDRQPLIEKKKIAARDGEPGTHLDNASLVGAGGRECFLELAGWRNADGLPEPFVSVSSKNTFSNRTAVAEAYLNSETDGGVPALRNSRFWYHAELFVNDRLQRLLSRGSAPDLGKVLAQLKNAALLNYYFFFPDHEEPIAGCQNVEAREFGSFTGEWQCFSILLERDDPAGDFRPTFVGVTGRLLTTLPPKTAQSPDLDDPARRIAMRVSPFSTMDLSSEHPNLFAAKGSHSLYLHAGTEATTYPDDLVSQQCGRFEGPLLPASTIYLSSPSAQDSSSDVWLAKVVAGAAVGGIGALIGLILAWLEVVVPILAADDTTIFLDVPADTPTADETGSHGIGKVVKPAAVNIPDAGSEVHDWLSAQGIIISDRQYDFLVDRAKQLWWPADAGEGGYRGRWGPRVEHDQFARRAGMRLPQFWRMFFLAFANGKDLKVF